MSADIIALDRARVRVSQTARTPSPGVKADRFHYWIGASKSRYVHSVYSLTACPEISDANYLLCKRHPATGDVIVLQVGVVATGTPSLNLAELRHRAAVLGAEEIHLHLLAGTDKRAKLIAYDLQTALQGDDHTASCASH